MAKQTRTVKRPGSRTPEPARRPAGVPAFDRVAAGSGGKGARTRLGHWSAVDSSAPVR